MKLEDLQLKLTAMPDAVALMESEPLAIIDGGCERGEWTFQIEPNQIRPVCEFLKSHRGYRMLSNSTVVDCYPSEPRFEVVYHLLCHDSKQRLRLKCKIGGEQPEISSVSMVWNSADWFEREIFDLFGIRFIGHPDLRRILLPDTWEGHPLRKDYPVTGYR